jgi:hypothetical protein
MTKAMLRVHVHAACPCPYCMSMSILHVMSMSMLHAHVNVHVYILYIEMPECRTVRHPVSPVSDWKKLTIPEQVLYRTNLTQSDIFEVRYRTKIRDAGMLMPALVLSMPMPSPAFDPTWSSCKLWAPRRYLLYVVCIHSSLLDRLKGNVQRVLTWVEGYIIW